MFEMPTRREIDGAVAVNRGSADTLTISVCHEGEGRSIVATRYNAARVLAMLCLMLEVPCPKALGKLPM